MTDPSIATAISLPASLHQRLEDERERQGVTNKSLFWRLALEAYLAKCEMNREEVTA